MEDILIMDAAERYLKEEMSTQEKAYFEDLRKNNPEIDQLVVEHIFFLNEMEKYGDTKNFKQGLQETATKLSAEGAFTKDHSRKLGKMAYLWNRYKRVSAVAASIAGLVSLLSIGVFSVYNNSKKPDLIKLNRKVDELEKTGRIQDGKLDKMEGVLSKIDPSISPKSGGTGFLIDGKGYMVTNAHVLDGKKVYAISSTGQEFIMKVCMKDESRDMAILKMDDKDFKPVRALPYSFNRSVNLASGIFTLGYPKDEVVYGEGYLSSLTGYKSDTLSYQIAISADHGNSGGPVLNKSGDVIGILTNKREAGAVFAIKSQYVINAVETMRTNPEYNDIKLSSRNTIRSLEREDQVKKINDFVFMIKSYDN